MFLIQTPTTAGLLEDMTSQKYRVGQKTGLLAAP